MPTVPPTPSRRPSRRLLVGSVAVGGDAPVSVQSSARVDVPRLTDQVTAAFDGCPHPLRVVVMGCVVNGPGEAREADLGVASDNGKGEIFPTGEVIRTVPESKIVETLGEEALRLAEETAS